MEHSVDADPGKTPAVLLVLNDVPEGMEVEFHRWYQQQHLPNRLSIPGINVARRYRALDAQPAHMAVYECQSLDVLSSSPYRDCLANPTDWARKLTPNFRNRLCLASRQTWSLGEGLGGAAIVVRCMPVPGSEDKARNFLKKWLGPALMESGCLVRISLWEAAADMTAGCAASADAPKDWVLFVESYDLARMALTLHSQVLASDGARTGLLIGSWARYQLICSRSARSHR